MPPKKVTTKPAGAAKKQILGSNNKGQTTTKTATRTVNKQSGKVLKKSPSKTKAASTPAKSSKETIAAVKIQKIVRGFLAKQKIILVKKQKQDYNDLIEKLQKEAWLDIVKKEQEEENKRREKDDAERRRKAQEKKWIKKFLESAFDGEIEELKKILKEVELNMRKSLPEENEETIQKKIQRVRKKFVNCADANENSALSESCAGGDLETVMFLLDEGADINCIGHFHRTPLYRAAFGGHLDVVKKVLDCGGDPRILDTDGVLAEQVATPEVISYFQEWDVSKTDWLLQKLQEKRDQISALEEAILKKEKKRLEDKIGGLEVDHSNKQKILRKTYTELNKRIYEHDECVAKGFERIDVTLQSIHDAEVDLARAQRAEEEARGKLHEAKLDLREQKIEGGEEEDQRIAKCNFKELDQVLFLDVGDVIKNSGKWPLILDSSGQAVTFLRYRDTNYLNLLNPKDVECETLRKALLGALRFGKSLVLDMLEVEMFPFLETRLDEIQNNLYNDLIGKELVSTNRYLCLIHEEDGKEYLKENFSQARLSRFQLVIISKMSIPPETWLDQFYTLRIVTQAS